MKDVETFGLRNWLIVAAAILLSLAIILIVSVPEVYEFSVGDICTKDIYAPRDIEDRVTTESWRDAAAAKVEMQYRTDYSISDQAKQKMEAFFGICDTARRMNEDITKKRDYIRYTSEGSMPDETMDILLNMTAADYTGFVSAMKQAFGETMSAGVRGEEEAVNAVIARLEAQNVGESQLQAAKELATGFVKVNAEYDETLTEEERERARQTVAPKLYKKSQLIVAQGEEISESQYALLVDLGYIKGEKSINGKYALGILLLILVSYAVGAFFIRTRAYRKEMKTGKLLLALLITVLMLLIVACCRGLNGVYLYLIPLPFAAILMATFVGMRLSGIAAVYLSFAACIMLGQGEEFILFSVLFCMLAAMIFKQVSGLSGYARAMLLMIAVGALDGIMISLLFSKPAIEGLYYALAGAGNGLLSSILAIGTTPVFENVFNITTPFKLNDLGNPEKPLLKRLMVEAPGTYHHSLMVGNLAEAACLEIGANAQLARVAAYYHDIGKLKRPEYYFENQIGLNPHDNLMPKESADVLKEHVDYGLEIARQNRLPQDIRDVIRQHHGTTVTGIFYRKAKEMDPSANEEDYKYPGPKPESKEAGIVMLADSCEAAVRSLDEKNEATIRAMVTKIVKGRMTDGQLDQCNLSFRELGKIIDAFVRMQSSYFHKRMKYDKEQENELDH